MATCAECHSEIDAEANTCPNCGHRPAEAYEEKASKYAKMTGWSILFIITSPLALVFGPLWWRNRQKAKSVTAAA